jgi:hypothetical protein
MNNERRIFKHDITFISVGNISIEKAGSLLGLEELIYLI